MLSRDVLRVSKSFAPSSVGLLRVLLRIPKVVLPLLLEDASMLALVSDKTLSAL